MKVIVVDISGKVTYYDTILCNAISKEMTKGNDVIFMAPYDCNQGKKIECKSKRLIALIPAKFRQSKGKFKRALKAFEGLINYLYLIIYSICIKADIIHMEFLPFLDFCSIENAILGFYKFLCPHKKFVLTIHDVYPHNIGFKQKPTYKARFVRIKKYFDEFVVHTYSCKNEVIDNYDINPSLINVIYHGVFIPSNYVRTVPSNSRGKYNIIVYGSQSYYKGTDILLDSIQYLDKSDQDKVHVTIAGNTPDVYLSQLKQIDKGYDVSYYPTYLPDQELYRLIDESEAICLPYRDISQSGVLLLALYFRKVLIPSDLPSFKETLDGFEDSWFFEADNPISLASLIKSHLNGKIDSPQMVSIIEELNKRYSWKESAKTTINLYSRILL